MECGGKIAEWWGMWTICGAKDGEMNKAIGEGGECGKRGENDVKNGRRAMRVTKLSGRS